MPAKNIIIKGAREHNLKNIDIELPRDRFIVITGISGSGKSTLAFDTLYAEGQRRYVESLSAYARQFLGIMNKPDVDSIEGISPAISIEQKTTSKNPRSTVGTVTEIYDYLRLLFARIGVPHCPDHGIEITAQSPERISRRIAEELGGGGVRGSSESDGSAGLDSAEESSTSATILAPIVRQKKGTYEKLVSDLNKEGYSRVRVNKEIYRTDEKIQLDRYKKHRSRGQMGLSSFSTKPAASTYTRRRWRARSAVSRLRSCSRGCSRSTARLARARSATGLGSGWTLTLT